MCACVSSNPVSLHCASQVTYFSFTGSKSLDDMDREWPILMARFEHLGQKWTWGSADDIPYWAEKATYIHPIQKKVDTIQEMQQDGTHLNRRVTRTLNNGSVTAFTDVSRGLGDALYELDGGDAKDALIKYIKEHCGMTSEDINKLPGSYWRSHLPTTIKKADGGWNSAVARQWISVMEDAEQQMADVVAGIWLVPPKAQLAWRQEARLVAEGWVELPAVAAGPEWRQLVTWSLNKPNVQLMPSFLQTGGGSKVESVWARFGGVPSGPNTGRRLMHNLCRRHVLRWNVGRGIKCREEYDFRNFDLVLLVKILTKSRRLDGWYDALFGDIKLWRWLPGALELPAALLEQQYGCCEAAFGGRYDIGLSEEDIAAMDEEAEAITNGQAVILPLDVGAPAAASGADTDYTSHTLPAAAPAMSQRALSLLMPSQRPAPTAGGDVRHSSLFCTAIRGFSAKFAAICPAHTHIDCGQDTTRSAAAPASLSSRAPQRPVLGPVRIHTPLSCLFTSFRCSCAAFPCSCTVSPSPSPTQVTAKHLPCGLI